MNEKTCANCKYNIAEVCFGGLSNHWMEEVPGTACDAWKPCGETQKDED